MIGPRRPEEHPRIRRAIRLLARAPSHYPIRVVMSACGLTPRCKGEGYHYTTKSGKPVSHPNAYRRAWGKPVYHCSTLRVEVGRDWITALYPTLWEIGRRS